MLAKLSTASLLLLLSLRSIHGETESSNGNLRGGRVKNEQRRLVSSEDPMVWNKDFVNSLLLATYLNHVVKTDDLFESVDKYNSIYQNFVVFDDGINDAAMVVKNDDVCHVIFRSQVKNSILDLLQTVSPFVKRNVFGSNCDVRRSFYAGYETNYADQLRAEVDSCVASCDGGQQCPLVLGGGSSGGAIAAVAALDPRLKRHNPITFTWGAIRSVVNDECTDLDTNTIYRFVTANSGYYDAIIDASPKMGKHSGHLILLDEMDNGIYLGLDNNLLRTPDSYSIHDVEIYQSRITNLVQSSEYPLKLNTGFDDGHWCTQDDECKSFCSSGVCTSPGVQNAPLLAPGSPCQQGAECESGSCLSGRCTLLNGLAAVGAPCVEHAECVTQRCSMEHQHCLPKRFTFGWCEEDADCLSGFCGGEVHWYSVNKQQKCLEP